MRTKDLAVAVLCSGLFALPVTAQEQPTAGTTAVGTTAAETPLAEMPAAEVTPVVAPPVVVSTVATPAECNPGTALRATFADIKDAVPGRWFDAAATETEAAKFKCDPANPTTLAILFNSGTDPKTWKNNAFIASTNAFYYPSVMDAIGFSVKSPPGHYIAKITYSQRGTGSIARTGKVSGGASWLVGNVAAPLGIFGTNPTLTGTMDLTEQYLDTVHVSITVGLHTFATPQLGSATVSLTGAEVIVELQEKPSAKLFGTAQ